MPVYKDKKRGTWYFAYNGEREDGTMGQIKRRGFAKKKDAIAAEAESKAKKEKQTDYSFDFMAKEYLKWYELRRKESSVKVIRNIIKNHLLPEFGHLNLSKIAPEKITAYQDRIIKEFSPHFLDKVHTTLSAVFNYAFRTYDYKENPARKVGNFQVEKKGRIRYWTLEEFKQFIEVVDHEVYQAFFYFLYYSGARQGEVRALRWNDFDFEKNTAFIDETVNYKGDFTSPKTSESIRTIPMPSKVMNLLKELKKRYPVDPKEDYVVFGEFYSPIAATTLQRWYDKYLKESGVSKIVMHEFRHSHASYLINHGADPGIVAERLGHKNKEQVLNTYSHLYPTKQQEIVSMMEDEI